MENIRRNLLIAIVRRCNRYNGDIKGLISGGQVPFKLLICYNSGLCHVGCALMAGRSLNKDLFLRVLGVEIARELFGPGFLPSYGVCVFSRFSNSSVLLTLCIDA